MRVLCSWCKQELGETATRSRAGRSISHGICEECAYLFEAFEPVHLGRFLDRFAGPVLLIDAAGKVLAGNATAARVLDIEQSCFGGHLTGEVIECVHSRERGGCGQTVHCTGCTIRNALRHTLETGESRWGVEAYQHVFTAAGVEHLRVLVTTERWRGRVLLRIDAKLPPRAA